MKTDTRKVRIVCQGQLTYVDVFELVSNTLIPELPWLDDAPGVPGNGGGSALEQAGMQAILGTVLAIVVHGPGHPSIINAIGVGGPGNGTGRSYVDSFGMVP